MVRRKTSYTQMSNTITPLQFQKAPVAFQIRIKNTRNHIELVGVDNSIFFYSRNINLIDEAFFVLCSVHTRGTQRIKSLFSREE